MPRFAANLAYLFTEYPALERFAAAAAQAIEQAVDRAFATGLKPCEFGGRDGTAAVAKAVLGALPA